MDNTLPPLKRIAAIHDLSGLGKWLADRGAAGHLGHRR